VQPSETDAMSAAADISLDAVMVSNVMMVCDCEAGQSGVAPENAEKSICVAESVNSVTLTPPPRLFPPRSLAPLQLLSSPPPLSLS